MRMGAYGSDAAVPVHIYLQLNHYMQLNQLAPPMPEHCSAA